MAVRQSKARASAVMSELMDVLGGRPEPAHTALACGISITGERYKLEARPASTTAIDSNVVSRGA